MKVELHPFQTPNFVIAVTKPQPRQEGFKQAPSYPLSDVPKDELEAMCKAFRDEVMKKAGYQP